MLSIKYLSIFIILGGAAAWGEVIANKKIVDKKFNVWNVSCEEDEMLGKIRCIMFVEITNKTTILVNPHNNHKILLISKDGYSGKNFSMKVDNGKLIVSKPLSDEKYGIVNFSDEDLKNLFEQIKSGSNLYMRFA
ncbi:MAG: hypothetical protein LBP39_00865, partial [Rickettsiales bacterium]|nr:hypothetical protein [Rickettsiales bacterium]